MKCKKNREKAAMKNWQNTSKVRSRNFYCGHCGYEVASNYGYATTDTSVNIRICPHCDEPTYFDYDTQVPGAAPGAEVESVPEVVINLYNESRKCISVNAFTASVLTSRKLLMNLAVSEGAETGKSFLFYVGFLADSGYVPPNGRGWVDHIRNKGNEATHEIVAMSRDDAVELVSFSEMLLKFIYEFPARVPMSQD